MGCIPYAGSLQVCENPRDAGFDPATFPLGTIRMFDGTAIPQSFWMVSVLGDGVTREWVRVRG